MLSSITNTSSTPIKKPYKPTSRKPTSRKPSSVSVPRRQRPNSPPIPWADEQLAELLPFHFLDAAKRHSPELLTEDGTSFCEPPRPRDRLLKARAQINANLDRDQWMIKAFHQQYPPQPSKQVNGLKPCLKAGSYTKVQFDSPMLDEAELAKPRTSKPRVQFTSHKKTTLSRWQVHGIHTMSKKDKLRVRELQDTDRVEYLVQEEVLASINSHLTAAWLRHHGNGESEKWFKGWENGNPDETFEFSFHEQNKAKSVVKAFEDLDVPPHIVERNKARRGFILKHLQR